MKKFSKIFYLSLLLTCSLFFLLGGCKKSGDKPGDERDPNAWNDGTLSANIGGTSWKANSVYAVDSSNLIFIVAGTNITGTNSYPFVLMAFPDNIAEGTTVNFDVTQASMLQYYENQNTVYYADPALGGSGSVTITKFNKGTKRIEGNFSASLKNATPGGTSKALSGGRFEINYR